ncbi:MAG: hypothetical protein P1U86_05030 [Verrucomicrobiales bacterium]|nr:hypothetical protein [Verrucomicrobiales bacterium]
MDEALELLVNRSVELDTREPDPTKRGISMVLRPEWSSHKGRAAAPEVSAQGENLSLGEAISLVARSVDKKWRVSNGAVVVGGQIWGPRIDENLSPEIAKTLAEWNTITLPSINFENTPLSEALRTIQQKAVEFDPIAPTRPIDLKIHPSTEPLESAGHRIDLKLRNATAYDALAHSFAQGGYDFEVREKEFHIDDLGTNTYILEWDHWLWMMRIAKRDPGFTPPNFDPTDKSIRMFGIKHAKQIYEDCGTEVNEGESFIYSVVTIQMITRLGSINYERVQKIHKTMNDWRAGRIDEWHLDWLP